MSLAAAYCIGYHEHFYASPGQGGPSSYTCYVALVDPDGFTLTPGSARAFVTPAARDHGGPPVAALVGATAVPSHAATWAAARAQALGPARVAALYAAYVAGKKKGVPRPQAEWWGVPGQRGGARHTVEGCLGEYQADQLFAAQGHKKLNHGGQLVGLLDPPRGKGLDGVWQNATPPPTYLITETKYGGPPRSPKAK